MLINFREFVSNNNYLLLAGITIFSMALAALYALIV